MAIPAIPSIKEIRNRIISDIEGTINQTIPGLPKAFIRILAGAIAGVVYLLYQAILWVYKQIFPQTAEFFSLQLLGFIVNVNVISEVSAIIICDVPGVTGQNCNAGIVFTGSNSIQYRVQVTVLIVGGVAPDVEMRSLTGGDVGNLADGEILNISATDLALDGTATVTSTDTSGADRESDESYRTRVISRYKKRATGGSAADYNNWGLETPNFIWVGPFNDETITNRINVYGKVDNQTDGIPTSSQLLELLSYLKFDPVTGKAYRRPINDEIITLPITTAEFTVMVSIKDGTPDIKSQITVAVKNYITTLEPYIEGISDIRKDTLTKSNVSNVASDIAEVGGAIIIDVEITETLTANVENRYTFYGSEFGKITDVTYTDIT